MMQYIVINNILIRTKPNMQHLYYLVYKNTVTCLTSWPTPDNC